MVFSRSQTSSDFSLRLFQEFLCSVQKVRRDGLVSFGSTLEEFNIPLCVFSAGIGDIIEIIFQQTFGHVPSNLHIISNFMEYDETGTVCGFRPPLLHSFNKCTAAIDTNSKFFDDLQNRPNVILLGDMLGDVQMDRGLVYEECILRIGFLNEQIEKSFSQFLDTYDLVLVDDQTFNVPNIILKALLGFRHRDGFSR
ncbi:unnamed protein product [Soboliphyme baturini]|uniref:5'-nucleotidase n=1 Tax=Soboliphyme baturini TaxID=241478 RepID=A0A183IN99_9BILA|nr:unnamed protein product [Soboliphyme baturini]